jgi:hypothetical protein
MGIKWIEHNGKRILYADYRKAKDDIEMISLLVQVANIIKQFSGKTLTMINFEGAFISPDFMVLIKDIGKEIAGTKIEKTAIIGMTTALKKHLLDEYNDYTKQKNNKIFEDEEEAKEWLAS